ncbi:MAG: hypothetical protein FD171_326 [Actinobacteria bacterium]|nr:MAG: hypothetical protein FD171_326 [Actinomycetota bacterium]MDO8950299.1 YbaN family protein [Actinomycetota bacterium]
MDEQPTATSEPRRGRFPRWLLLGFGWACVVLGFIGVFVPGMPTTTFLLIAAWCFYRSSERAHTWLLQHRILGPYVRDFLSGKGMPLRSKVIAVSMMWLTCGASALFFVPALWAKVLVLSCAVIGTVMVSRVPTRVAEAPEPAGPDLNG